MQHAHCQNCSDTFTVKDEDLAFYTSMQVPPPTFCPPCRFRRRASHISSRSLYPRVLTPGDAPKISMYSQDKDLNIVDDKDWWSDTYDMLSFGARYDFAVPFFTQFHALWKRVPLPHLQREYASMENSEFCNAFAGLKNCYLMINADNSESCSYGFAIENSKDCTDFSFTNNCELCYEAVNLQNCYACLFCDSCENCNGLRWCRDCVGCTDCFGCSGLRHKQYCLFNVQMSKEDYEKEIAQRSLGSFRSLQSIREECEAFFLSQPRKHMEGSNNDDCSGDYVSQAKDVHESFMVKKAEHSTFAHFLSFVTSGTSNAYDYTSFGVGADNVYECAWCGIGINNIKFCLWTYGAADLEYCFGCHYSKNLFGCIGLRHKQYCILNTQYTKEEYEAMLPRIKKQMMEIPYVDTRGRTYRYGEFFPSELSPFAYNETWAREYSPLTKAEALRAGYAWHDPEERTVAQSISWKDLPDEIRDVSDDDLRTPILCKAYDDDPTTAVEHGCTQYFKIIPQELAFYRRMGLALPRACHNSRHAQRLTHLNPFTLYDRTCTTCGTTIRTTYAPDRREPVLCNACYEHHAY